MRLAVILLSLAAMCAQPITVSAQIVPQPSAKNPRLQTVQWSPGEEVILTALPGTGLTVMLEPGEQISRVTLDNPAALDVRVSVEGDSFMILPLIEQPGTGILVQTDRRDYRFNLQTAMSLMAAYLVEFQFDPPETAIHELSPAPLPRTSTEQWSYNLRGDSSVRPASIKDDGTKTMIAFGDEQDLPAVFAIGPTGDEQVVNGHMRNGIFVIDRVYSELVFRIDKDKATARRNREANGA